LLGINLKDHVLEIRSLDAVVVDESDNGNASKRRAVTLMVTSARRENLVENLYARQAHSRMKLRHLRICFQDDRLEWHGIKADFGAGFPWEPGGPAESAASGFSPPQGFPGNVVSISAHYGTYAP
jgi:hypothetical protein